MKSTKTKSRGWLVTLSAAGVFALYVTCFFLPGQKSLTAVRKQTAEKRQAILTANLQRQSLPQLETQLQHTVKVVQGWQHTSPNDPHVVELLGNLATFAKQSGVRVQRLTPQESLPMATLRQHPVMLNVEGSFVQLVDFMSRLEGRPESIWVRQLGLKPSSENGTSVQCDLMLTVFADNREVSG
jgi:Tfp pilus assembly protein PilO